jgi:surface protein
MTKLSNLTKVTTVGDDALFYIVDPARSAGDRSVGMDKDDVQTLVGGGGSNTPVSKTGTNIVFTEEAEYYADASFNPIESGNLLLDLTNAVVGTTVNVYLRGYAPSITGASFIELSDTSDQANDIYSFYNAYDGIKLNKISQSTLTTPVLSFVEENEQIVVNWSTSIGATSYTLKRNTVNNFNTATTIYTGSLLTFTDAGLTNNTEYFYFIQATGAVGSYDSLIGTGSATPEAFAITDFVLTVKTDNVGSSSNAQFTMATDNLGSYNCTVDWGDGTSDTITTFNDPSWTHDFGVAGTYQIKISGSAFTKMEFANTNDKDKLISIDNWGLFSFGTSGLFAFWGCSNLVINATDRPKNLISTTNLQEVFRACSSITTIPNIDLWETQNVTTFSGAFRDCILLNQDMSGLDISGANLLSSMFMGCIAYNSPIPNNSTTSLTQTNNMFNGCDIFNQDVSSLVLTNATTVLGMFDGANAYTGLGAENLDVSSCTAFGFCFRNTSVDISFANWDVRSAAAPSGAVGFLDNTNISTANYDATLIGWDTRTGYNSLNWDFASANYTLGGSAESARNSLIGKGLTFTDGGGV